MTQDYSIAGHRIRLSGSMLVSAVATIEGFAPFLADETADVTPLITITQCEPAAIKDKISASEPLYSFVSEDEPQVESVFGRVSDGYTFSMIPVGDLPQLLWCSSDGHEALIAGHLDGNAMSHRLTRFSIWIAFGIAAAYHNTVAIHSSVIAYQGRSVLFLGESGTGKSTHTRLWREHIEGAMLLNDDSPIVRVIDGVVYAYGSPWSGKTPCYRSERLPLAACVRLSQAPCNDMRQLSLIEGYAALHPSCPPDFAYDDDLYDGICETLDQLLSLIPVYHLACLPDAAAARLSCQTVFG